MPTLPFDEVKVLPAEATEICGWDGAKRAAETGERPVRAAFLRAGHRHGRALPAARPTGALWIGCEFGLFRWDKNELKTFSLKDGFSPAYVLAVTEDKAGDIWLGTALGELRRFHAGKFESFRPQDSLTDRIHVESGGGSRSARRTAAGARCPAGNGFGRCIWIDDGVIWIGTLGGGLLRFQDGKFTRYTSREGLPSEHVSQILGRCRGQLWLGTRARHRAREQARVEPLCRTAGKFCRLRHLRKIRWPAHGGMFRRLAAGLLAQPGRTFVVHHRQGRRVGESGGIAAEPSAAAGAARGGFRGWPEPARRAAPRPRRSASAD